MSKLNIKFQPSDPESPECSREFDLANEPRAQGRKSNAKTRSIEDIERRISVTLAEIAEIKAQIGEAKSIAAKTGEYSDPQWFRRANYALRLKGIEHQSLLLEYGKKRKEEKAARNVTLEREFINVAKTRLDPTSFRLLMDEALARIGQYASPFGTEESSAPKCTRIGIADCHARCADGFCMNAFRCPPLEGRPH